MPEWEDAIRARLARSGVEGAREQEIVEELARHLDDRYRELLGGGLGETEARRLALEELDGGELPEIRPRVAREPVAIGAGGGSNLMAGMWHDLKVAFRMMRSKPAFSAAVVFMLALGVAGNTAIFSIFDGLFLRPLPFAEPQRLVDLDETAPKWNLKYVGVSNPDFDAWRKGNSTFDGMAFFAQRGANLSDDSGTAQRISTATVTRDMLSVLGLKLVLGRDFLVEEDRPGGPKVVLLGYDLWQRLYHGDRGAVGRILKLDGEPHTVVGVLPREAAVPPEAEAWTPLAVDTTKGGSYYLLGAGRLKRGVTIDQARADLLRVHRAQIKTGAKINEITSPVIQPLRDRYLGDYRTVMQILLGAVGVVLLIACVNIAGLMLVRGEARAREIAIRSAVGASRGTIIRQLLTESLLLAALGGGLGVAGGKVCLRALVSLMPDDMPRWIRFDLDGRFAIFAIAVTGAAALLFGLAPALQAAAVDAYACLQEASRSTLTRGRRAVLSSLVVCEIGLALMLLVSSGLLVQAFRKVLQVNPGFRPENVITWSLRFPESRYPKYEQRFALLSGLLERLRGLPGVRSASAASLAPLGGHSGTFFKVANGRVFGPNEPDPVVLEITAMPGYCEAMGMTFLAGRDFDARDEADKAPPVVVINEAFARHFWGTTDAVGKRIRYGYSKDWMLVAGVIRDVRHYGLDGEVRPSVMAPYRIGQRPGMTVAMRTSGDPRTFVAPARDAIRQFDPDLPMFEIRTMTERIDRSLWVRRAYSWLFAAFAAVAVVLAAAGIYGVISFAVSQRTREIGIRIALGARPGQVMRRVLAGGMLLVAAGVALGLAASQLAASFLKSLLFGVSTKDAATYAAVVAAVAAVGLLANYFPARRAAAVDPMRALRSE